MSGTITAASCDQSDAASVTKFVAEAELEMGGIDVMINNVSPRVPTWLGFKTAIKLSVCRCARVCVRAYVRACACVENMHRRVPSRMETQVVGGGPSRPALVLVDRGNNSATSAWLLIRPEAIPILNICVCV